MCGILTGIQRQRNKEGKAWASMQLEDRYGSLEAMVFFSQLRAAAALPGQEDKAVLSSATVMPEDNAAAEALRAGHHPA